MDLKNNRKNDFFRQPPSGRKSVAKHQPQIGRKTPVANRSQNSSCNPVGKSQSRSSRKKAGRNPAAIFATALSVAKTGRKFTVGRKLRRQRALETKRFATVWVVANRSQKSIRDRFATEKAVAVAQFSSSVIFKQN